MKLPEINLDDISYEDLMKEAMALIAADFPMWKDYPSEPGIILSELFAFMAECAIYQINRMPSQSYKNFGRLLGMNVNDDKSFAKEAQEFLKRKDRGVTLKDYEDLAVELSLEYNGIETVVRAKADVFRKAVEGRSKEQDFIRVLLVTNGKGTEDEEDEELEEYCPSSGLCKFIISQLKYYGLIGTCFLVTDPGAEPYYTDIELKVIISCVQERFLSKDAIRKNIEDAFNKHVDPLKGGTGEGWDFGKYLYSADLFKLLSDVDGVDYVEGIFYRYEDEEDSEYSPVGEYIRLNDRNVFFKINDVEVEFTDGQN